MTWQNNFILKCSDELLVVVIVGDLSYVHHVDVESEELEIVIHDQTNEDDSDSDSDGGNGPNTMESSKEATKVNMAESNQEK